MSDRGGPRPSRARAGLWIPPGPCGLVTAPARSCHHTGGSWRRCTPRAHQQEATSNANQLQKRLRCPIDFPALPHQDAWAAALAVTLGRRRCARFRVTVTLDVPPTIRMLSRIQLIDHTQFAVFTARGGVVTPHVPLLVLPAAADAASRWYLCCSCNVQRRPSSFAYFSTLDRLAQTAFWQPPATGTHKSAAGTCATVAARVPAAGSAPNNRSTSFWVAWHSHLRPELPLECSPLVAA
jgi:hypothetical protein